MTTWTSEGLAEAFWEMIQKDSDLGDLLESVERILAKTVWSPMSRMRWKS